MLARRGCLANASSASKIFDRDRRGHSPRWVEDSSLSLQNRHVLSRSANLFAVAMRLSGFKGPPIC
eukprot:scaffold269142_cov37-Tisochrysis_lutea.AAC.1